MTSSKSSSSSNLSIVEANGIDAELFDMFGEYSYTEIIHEQKTLTKEESLGIALTRAMTVYTDLMTREKQTKKQKELIHEKNIPTTHIIVKNINPKIHKKFKKYVKKTYGSLNFNENYNKELNILISTYVGWSQLPTHLYIETIQKIENKTEYFEIKPSKSIKYRQYITTELFKKEFHLVCQEYGLEAKEAELYDCL